MGKGKSLDPRQLKRVQKMLEERTQNVVKITQQEAAEKLEPQLRQAIQNGYSPKEISQMLKDAGFPIPAKILREVEGNPQEIDTSNTKASQDSSPM